MKRLPLRTLALMSAALAVTPAAARTTITPYIEVQQVLTADLSGNGGDTVSYTGLTGGVNATFDSPKFQGQVDFSYDHYFSWSHRFRDSNIYNGLGSVIYHPTSDFSLQAAGIATRARGAFAGGSPGLVFGNLGGTQQIYSIQAGPTYKRSFGDVDAQADYRFGWTRSNDGIGSVTFGPDQATLQNNFTTVSHTADASVGMRPGTTGLPFGWKVSGGYEHDAIHYLDGRYTDKYGRVDLTFPVTDTFALEAGAGYESARATQSAILVDPLTDDAILDSGGHLQADHTRPRLLAYDESGLIWDVGVLWRPSTRTELEVRGGQRYGQAVVTGHFTHKLTQTASLEVVAYDDITSFGRQLSGEIGSLPTSFSANTLPFATTLNTCVFGANGSTGGCLNALNSVNANFYRSRGVFALVSGTRASWTYGLGVGYENRRYIAPSSLAADVLSFDGAHEQSVTFDASLGRELSRRSQLTMTALVSWYDNDAIGTGSYTAYGVIGTYSYEFSRRLIGSASLGISSGTNGAAANDVAGTALIALRYQL